MNGTFRTIDGKAILWTDKVGVTHRCEGADVHPGVRLLWTDCERDVPANAAFLPSAADNPTCPRCLATKKGAPYGEMCRDPGACAGKGYCPRDPSCGD